MITHPGHPIIRAFCFSSDLKHYARFDAIDFISGGAEFDLRDFVLSDWRDLGLRFSLPALAVWGDERFPGVSAACDFAVRNQRKSGLTELHVHLCASDAIGWLSEHRPQAWGRLSANWQSFHDLKRTAGVDAIPRAFELLTKLQVPKPAIAIFFEQSSPDVPFWDTPKYLQQFPGAYETHGAGNPVLLPTEHRDLHLDLAFRYASSVFANSAVIPGVKLAAQLPVIFEMIGDESQPLNSTTENDPSALPQLFEHVPQLSHNSANRRVLAVIWDVYAHFRDHCNSAEGIFHRSGVHQAVWDLAASANHSYKDPIPPLILAAIVKNVGSHCPSSDDDTGEAAASDGREAKAKFIEKTRALIAQLTKISQEFLAAGTANSSAAAKPKAKKNVPEKPA